MSLVIGIDPAYGKPTAVTCWYNDKIDCHFQLKDCYDWHEMCQTLEDNLPSQQGILIIEGQEIYKNSPVKTDVILELANRTGFIEAAVRATCAVSVFRVAPKRWKGQVEPRVMLRRMEHLHGKLPGTIQEREDYAHSLGLVMYYLKNQNLLLR